MNGSDHLLVGVYAIFFSEIVTITLMQLVDIGGNLKRHVFAPRAQTQEDLNQCMSGSVVELAERYTVSKLWLLKLCMLSSRNRIFLTKLPTLYRI